MGGPQLSIGSHVSAVAIGLFYDQCRYSVSQYISLYIAACRYSTGIATGLQQTRSLPSSITHLRLAFKKQPPGFGLEVHARKTPERRSTLLEDFF